MSNASSGRTTGPKRRGRGFETAGGLVRDRIRSAGESRGFAVSRLLTHWAEVVGSETAAMARPVKIGYGREGFGATLTLLTTGAWAPVLQMREQAIREKVNACYGYPAIVRIVITQTAPIGFAEGQAQFCAKPPAGGGDPDPAMRVRAAALSDGVRDEHLRAALEALGEKVLSRPGSKKG